jgi:Lrp/AsnC family transcriptional regulator, regulator for asnA, asnC and gidA
MYKPDQTDWKIIALLNKDGRMSSAEIARELGDVSARTIKNRIDALTQHGIINIRSIINPEALGYDVLADVFIETEPGQLRAVADSVAQMSLVTYVACATGDTDIIISVRAHDIKELYNFVLEQVENIPGVRHTKTFPLPLSLKGNDTWMPPDVGDTENHNSS